MQAPASRTCRLGLLLAALSFCVVLAGARAFTLRQAAPRVPMGLRCGAIPAGPSIGSALVSRRGGGAATPTAGSSGSGSSRTAPKDDDDDGLPPSSFRAQVREIRNGYTSDGRRRLFALNELFAQQGPEDGPPTFSASGGRTSGLLSRDGLFKVAGYAAVAYVGKQFFNGGRYDEAPDLSGKVAVVTGGNTGIGKETALRLAQLGAKVFIACRSPERGEAAAKDLNELVANSDASTGPNGVKLKQAQPVESLVMDLADLRTIDKLASQLARRTDRVDLLINNAGVMAVTNLERTAQGFERHVGVNHLGHFHLTNKLWDLLKASPSARIINVSSEAHRFGGLDLEDLNYEKREYKKWEAYGQSKLANILFTRELDKKIREKGLGGKILTVCCHPGVVRTELGRYLVDDIPSFAKVALAPAAIAGWYFTKSPKQGAQTQLYLAASPSLREEVGGDRVGGTYFSDCRPKSTAKEAEDLSAADGLWALSEKLTGASFNV